MIKLNASTIVNSKSKTWEPIAHYLFENKKCLFCLRRLLCFSAIWSSYQRIYNLTSLTHNLHIVCPIEIHNIPRHSDATSNPTIPFVPSHSDAASNQTIPFGFSFIYETSLKMRSYTQIPDGNTRHLLAPLITIIYDTITECAPHFQD